MKTASITNGIKIASGAIGGALSAFIGGLDGAIYALIVFVIIDYITGVMCAIAEKQLSSEIGFKGICRKILIFALVGVGNILDMYIIKTGTVLRTAVIFFYLANEGISILENAARLGLPVPAKLKAVLEQLKDNQEKEGESDDC